MRYQILILAFTLAACTTYSKQECENMDWGTAGYRAALEGGTLDQTQARYVKGCTRDHGVRPDEARIKLGYETGMKEFCEGKTALEFARGGGVYHGTCSGEQETGFLAKYQVGRIEYLAAKVEELSREVSDLRGEKSRLESQVSDLEGKLRSRD